MRVTKRTLLVGAGGVLIASPAAFIALDAEVAIYDGRVGESREFAREAAAAGARLLDIADAEETGWRIVRNGVRGSIIGLTRWSDWTILRGALEAQGRRVRRELRLDYRPNAPAASNLLQLVAGGGPTRVVARGAREATLFAWRIS